MSALEQAQSLRPVGVEAGSQGTVIESTRAAAEVAASVQVAKNYPRSTAAALAAMRDATGRWRLAEAAQFSFRRGGQNVAGPSIQLARELARCWGNIQYGITELGRTGVGGQSEMRAWACDVEQNVWASTVFIVEHVRETKTHGRTALTSDRDVYENNANMGARRVREMILSVLPQWYRDEAIDRCAERLTRSRDGGDPVPLADRVLGMLEAFAGIGVTKAMLEARQGPEGRWTALDVAALGVLFRTIQRGETTVGEEFGGDQLGSMADVARPPAEHGAPFAAARAELERRPVQRDPESGQGPGEQQAAEQFHGRSEQGAGAAVERVRARAERLARNAGQAPPDVEDRPADGLDLDGGGQRG